MTNFTYGLLLIPIVIGICCFSCERKQNPTEVDSDNEKWKIRAFKPQTVETETYNNGIIIQNSFPKGDGYRDSKGKIYRVAIFWTRIINRTKQAIELSFEIKADSLVNPAMGNLYSTLFLPPDTMTLDKDQLYGYGITDLKSVLDNRVNEPTSLRRRILPDQEYMFRVGMFTDANNILASEKRNYVLRSGLVLKKEDLIYIIRANSDSTVVPFGKIVFAN